MTNELDGLQPKTLDVKRIIKNFLSYKFYFGAVATVALVIAFVINLTSVPLYYNQATFILKEDKNNQFMSGNDFFRGVNILGANQESENQLAVLSSFNLAFKTIKRLDYKVSYYSRKKVFKMLPYVSTSNLYKNGPFTVYVDEVYPQATGVDFTVIPIDSLEFYLVAEAEAAYLYNYLYDRSEGKVGPIHFKQKFKFGEKIKTQFLDAEIVLNTDVKYLDPETEYYFKMNNTRYMANYLKGALNVQSDLVKSSTVVIALKGDNPYFIHDYLNEFLDTYIEQNLQSKNNAASLTINFIDRQISSVSDSLDFVESQLQNYRAQNQITDLSYQGEQLLGRISSLEAEKSKVKMRAKYYNYIQEYFNKSKDVSDLVAPSMMGADDPVLSRLIEQVLELNAERIRLIDNGNTKNLYLKNLDLQINNMKSTIEENIRNGLKTTQLTLDDLNSQLNKLTSELRKLPGSERKILNMQRQFKLNDEIYTYLLKKRAEAQIAAASSISDIEVVDPAMLFYFNPISPNKKMNYLIALFGSAMMVVGLIIVKDFFNTRIRSKDDVVYVTDFPVIGEIGHTRDASSNTIVKNPNSIFAEYFRNIRTNLQFFSPDERLQTILISSAISKEGKTFIAHNIAKILSVNDKKVVLMDLDLRKPSLHKVLKTSNDIGITSFLINSATIDDVVFNTDSPNLDFIPTGPKAPNPAELINSQNIDLLLDLLRDRYDYVILDTSPVGLVSESFILMNKVDLNLFPIRVNYSLEDLTRKTLQQAKQKGITNISIIVNDIEKKELVHKKKYGKNYYTKS